jgi:hypothetical protein
LQLQSDDRNLRAFGKIDNLIAIEQQSLACLDSDHSQLRFARAVRKLLDEFGRLPVEGLDSGFRWNLVSRPS